MKSIVKAILADKIMISLVITSLVVWAGFFGIQAAAKSGFIGPAAVAEIEEASEEAELPAVDIEEPEDTIEEPEEETKEEVPVTQPKPAETQPQQPKKLTGGGGGGRSSPSSPGNSDPVLNIPTQNLTRNTNKTFNLVPYGSDPDSDSLSFSVTETNASFVNCSLNATEVNLTLIPALNFVGVANCTIRLEDNRGGATVQVMIINVTGTDNQAPIWSQNKTNITTGFRDVVWFSINWSDNLNLSHAAFSFDNGSGIFVNETVFNLQGNRSAVLNLTRQINTSKNNTIRWRWYANDTQGNSNVTDTWTDIIDNTAPVSSLIPNFTWPEDNKNISLNLSSFFSDIDNDDLDWIFTQPINITVALDNNTGKVNFTPNANWTGIGYIRFTAIDTAGAVNLSNNITLNVTPVNDIPFFNPNLVNQTIALGNSLLYDINCTDIEEDILEFHDNTTLFDINSSTGLINDAPSASELGLYSINISCDDNITNRSQSFLYNIIDTTAPAWTDNLTNASDSVKTQSFVWFSINFSDNANLSHTIFSFDNGSGIFVNDSAISLNGSTSSIINISRQLNATRGQIVRWRFYANDTSGNVNETNIWNVTIANTDPNSSMIQTLKWPEDFVNSSLNLSNFYSDLDNDDINWTFAVGQNVTVNINNNTGIVNLTPLANWSGISYVQFTGLDLAGGSNKSNNVTLNITSVNDLPVLNLSRLTFIHFPEDTFNITNLSLHVFDVEDLPADINWSCQTNYSIVGMTEVIPLQSNVSKILNITAQKNFTGHANITCTAFDKDNGQSIDSFLANVTQVNDAPDINSVNINSTDALNRTNGSLTGLFSALDIDNLTTFNETRWYNGSVEIAELANRTFVHEGNVSKGQSWIFSARIWDGEFFSSWLNSTTILIRNALPIFAGPIPTWTWDEETVNSTLNLSQFFSDIDLDDLDWTVQVRADNVTVEINNATGNVTFIPNANFTGLNFIVFNATDGDGGFTLSNNITLNITNVQDVPYFNPNIANDGQNKTALIGSPFIYDINCTDPDPLDTISYADNMTQFDMNISTGIINWTPLAADTSPFAGFILWGINITCDDAITKVNETFIINVSCTIDGESCSSSSQCCSGTCGGTFKCV